MILAFTVSGQEVTPFAVAVTIKLPLSIRGTDAMVTVEDVADDDE